MRNTFRFVVMMAALGVLLPSGAGAQVLERPSRPFRGLFGGGPPPDPNRTRQELTLTTNLLGGFEDVFSPGGEPAGELFRAQEGAYTGFAEARLRYWWGREGRLLDVSGRGYTNAYSVGLNPNFGADLDVQADSTLGRRNHVGLRQTVNYLPVLALGGFGPIESEVDSSVLPDANPLNGLVNQRALQLDTTLSLTHDWTARHSTGVGYSYSKHQYLDEVGFDTRTQGVFANYGWSIRRSMRLQATYNSTEIRIEDQDSDAGPATSHAGNIGFSYDRALSRTRRIGFTAGAGMAHVRDFGAFGGGSSDEPQAHLTPGGYGSVRVDIGRTWALAANFNRALTVLDTVARQSFYANAAALQLGGLIGRRVDAAFSAAMANGRSVAGEGEGGRYGRFTGTAQMRWALSRCCATILSYDYYNYRLRNVTLPEGYPATLDRNAIRVGFTVWLPLYGSYSGGTEGTAGRGR